MSSRDILVALRIEQWPFLSRLLTHRSENHQESQRCLPYPMAMKSDYTPLMDRYEVPHHCVIGGSNVDIRRPCHLAS